MGPKTVSDLEQCRALKAKFETFNERRKAGREALDRVLAEKKILEEEEPSEEEVKELLKQVLSSYLIVLHLLSAPLALCPTCSLLHLLSDSLALCSTCSVLHLLSAPLALCFTCSLHHSGKSKFN